MSPATADNLKYVLRSLLELSRLKCVSHLPQPPLAFLSSAAYTISRRAMEAADSYESARLAFGCYWKGHAQYSNPNGRHVLSSDLCPRHEMLDRLVPEYARSMTLTGNPVPWLEATIVQDGQIDPTGRRISYKFRESVPRRLAESLPESRQFLPVEWMAWGHDASTVRQVLSALRYRCLYHGIAINTLAAHFGVIGGGLDDLLLRMEWQRLVAQVAKLAGALPETAADLLGHLRFGNSTTNPDPALQPIIPVGRQEVVLPCWTVTTSSIERNLLTLQARVNRREFDRQSWLFERKMARQLEGVLERIGLRFRSHFATPAGEADLVLASKDGTCVLVVELKWFLPPGDLRETLERTETVRHGADQARRKLDALRSTGQATKALCLAQPPTSWAAVVVSEGFSTSTGDPSVACVPSAVFARLLDLIATGADLKRCLGEEPWLPVEGTHFQRETMPHTIGDVTFEWSFHSLLPPADDLAKQWVDEYHQQSHGAA